MFTNNQIVAAREYTAPVCDVLNISLGMEILETSFTSGSIEDGVLDEWGVL